jgi:hypothetical protein
MKSERRTCKPFNRFGRAELRCETGPLSGGHRHGKAASHEAALGEIVDHRVADRPAHLLGQGDRGLPAAAGVAELRQLDARAYRIGDVALNVTWLWKAVDRRGGNTTLAANTIENWRDIRHVFEAWGLQLGFRRSV